MDKHPIESLMSTTMENIRDMIDVNTVIGDAVQTPDGSTIIPISRVSFGFVAGGAEYGVNTRSIRESKPETLPFGGGTGAGVSVSPMGFLVMNRDSVRMLPASCQTSVDRLIELVPQLVSDVKGMLDKTPQNTPKSCM